jgi:hypothetical protein
MNKYSDIQLRRALPELSKYSLTPKSLISELPSHFSSSRISSRISSISHFSEVENFKAEAISSQILTTPMKLPLPTIEPKPVDFKSIILNLNRVLTRPDMSDIHQILEKEIVSNISAQNSVLYYKISTKDKKSPMKVEVKRKSGKLRWYLSKEWGKPGESSYEYVFFDDLFEVSAKKSHFENDFLYIGIQVLIDSEFSFMMSFPKANQKDHLEIHIKSLSLLPISSTYDYEYRYNLNVRVEKLKSKRKQKALQLSGAKDFVKLNKACSQISLNKESLPWKDRQENVLNKKNLLNQEKVQKAKEFINKRLETVEKNKRNAEFMKKHLKHKKRQIAWTRILSFLMTLSQIRRIILTGRKKQAIRKKINVSSKVILKGFVKILSKIRTRHDTFLTCKNNLKLFNLLTVIPSKKLIHSKLVLSMQESAVNMKITTSFEVYMKKIIFVQRKVRNFLKVSRLHSVDLVKYWNSVLSKLIVEHSKSKHNPFSKPINVESRNKILNHFYKKSSKKHVKMLKTILEIWVKNPNFREKITFPHFQHLPSEGRMRKMIKTLIT